MVEPFLESLRADPLAELESYFRQLVVGGDPDAARWVLEDLRLTHEDAVTGGRRRRDRVRAPPRPGALQGAASSRSSAT